MAKPPSDRMVAEIMDNIRRVFQVVNEQSKQVERETGLTGPQVWAIKVISEHGPVRVSDLAMKMYLHPATVGGILDRLEKRGLISRNRSTEDRRVVEVSLTDEGRSLVEHSPEVASNKITHGLESLENEELSVIHRGLDRLAVILDAKGLPPRLIGTAEVNLPRGGRGRSTPPPGETQG
ncbi:MAG: MarR family transcriptional regulator [Desulfuromonadales bacterium]|nr:MAG: MarR family transcriptional regulator [Desulfuromonadales bacterium]